MWGTHVPSPVPEDPAWYAGPKPVIQTAESEPACCTYWRLRPLEPVLRTEKRRNAETPAQWAAGAARRATPACHKERKLVRSNQDQVHQWREGKGSESRSVVFHSLQSHGYTAHGILYARILGWGTEPRSPTLQADSLPAESQGKPKNSGVSTLSLLQRIFPIQEWNRGLLHCRWIL